MIKCKTALDERAQKAFTKNFKIYSIIATVIGAIGIVAYIVTSLFVNSSFLDILLVFSLPFAFGVVYLFMINKTTKKTVASELVNEYEFDNNFFTVTSYKHSEQVGTIKVFYKEIYKIKEKNNYIFLYINRVNAYIVDTENLPKEDITLLRAILKINIKS